MYGDSTLMTTSLELPANGRFGWLSELRRWGVARVSVLASFKFDLNRAKGGNTHLILPRNIISHDSSDIMRRITAKVNTIRVLRTSLALVLRDRVDGDQEGVGDACKGLRLTVTENGGFGVGELAVGIGRGLGTGVGSEQDFCWCYDVLC